VATYRNPAAAIGECRRAGRGDSVGELYECAVGKAPNGARETWYREARRLASGAQLGRSRRGARFAGVRTFKRVKRKRRR
jgi:hypothetical protein